MTPQISLVFRIPLMKRSKSTAEAPNKQPSNPSFFRRWKSFSGALCPTTSNKPENITVVSRGQAKSKPILSSQAMTESSPRPSRVIDRVRVHSLPLSNYSGSQSLSSHLPSHVLSPEYVLDMCIIPSHNSSIQTSPTEISFLEKY